MTTTLPPLRLERRILDEIHAHARSLYPDECCGAVLRENGRDRVWRFTNIQDQLHAQNPEENPRTAATAYSPEPKELFAAITAGDRPGCQLLVFYHSHGINGSYFSDEDQRRALFGDEPAYPDVCYVVVSDARSPGEARAFRWNESAAQFTEAPIAITDEATA